MKRGIFKFIVFSPPGSTCSAAALQIPGSCLENNNMKTEERERENCGKNVRQTTFHKPTTRFLPNNRIHSNMLNKHRNVPSHANQLAFQETRHPKKKQSSAVKPWFCVGTAACFETRGRRRASQPPSSAWLRLCWRRLEPFRRH